MEISRDSLTTSLICSLDQYHNQLFRQASADSARQAKATEIAWNRRQKAKSVREERERSEREYRKRLEERAKRIDVLESVYASARERFISQVEISIRLNLSELLPTALAWEDLVRLPGDHNSEQLTSEDVQELIGKLDDFEGEDAGSFLNPCSALRYLWEPQSVIAIGERLLNHGETVIVPSYAGALLDLDFDQEAFDICREHWEEAKRARRPQYLARAYFRAAGRLGFTSTQDEIRDFAVDKFELGGPGSSLPKRLRNSRRQQIVAYRSSQPDFRPYPF